MFELTFEGRDKRVDGKLLPQFTTTIDTPYRMEAILAGKIEASEAGLFSIRLVKVIKVESK